LDSKSSFEAKLGREPGSGKRKTKGNSEFPGTGTRVGVGIIQREVNGLFFVGEFLVVAAGGLFI
jgi:hypothetical protein